MKFFVAAAALVAAVHAEADPALVYAGLPLAATYAYGVKSAPCVNAANVPVPCADGYAAAYHAVVPAIYGRKKREAEAEADPALLYGAYGYGLAGYPYAAYPYYGLAGVKSAPCVNAANIPVPCAGRKRRDAEADAAVLYSGYYGLPAVTYAAPHGVAATPYGLTHSSNVGVCLNYLGAQVPC